MTTLNHTPKLPTMSRAVFLTAITENESIEDSSLLGDQLNIDNC